MDTNITIPKKEIAPGVFSTGGVATMPTANPIQSNVITPQALQPVAPINLGTTPQPQTPSIQGDIEFFNQLQNQQSEAQKQLEGARNQGLGDVSKLMQELTGQGTEQLALEQQIVNPIQEQLQGLTGRIGTELADYRKAEQDYEKLKTDLEVGVRGSGNSDIRASMLFGQQGAIDRAKSSELNVKASNIALLQAEAQAVQGRLDLAQRQVDRAVDLKYKSKEQEIEVKKFQLGVISDLLTKEEKKQAGSLNMALNREEKRIAEAKENEKAISKMIIDATPNAPANVIANAKAIADKGGSTLEVAQALGKYGGDYLKTELLKQQIETEKAQRSNIYANIAKTKKETAAIGADGTKLTADEKKAQTASTALVGLLDTYKKEIEGISFMQANSPAKRTAINSLKGRITAEYKQAKQLGTLDAGVQKLIDSIIPNPGDFSISSLDNKAQVKAIDDFKKSFEVADPILDSYFNAATGSIQTVNNQINNKEKSFLMSLTQTP